MALLRLSQLFKALQSQALALFLAFLFFILALLGNPWFDTDLGHTYILIKLLTSLDVTLTQLFQNKWRMKTKEQICGPKV